MTNNKRKPTTSRGSHTTKPIMYIAHSPYISNIYKFPPIFVPFRFFDFSPTVAMMHSGMMLYTYWTHLKFTSPKYSPHPDILICGYSLSPTESVLTWRFAPLRMVLSVLSSFVRPISWLLRRLNPATDDVVKAATRSASRIADASFVFIFIVNILKLF